MQINVVLTCHPPSRNSLNSRETLTPERRWQEDRKPPASPLFRPSRSKTSTNSLVSDAARRRDMAGHQAQPLQLHGQVLPKPFAPLALRRPSIRVIFNWSLILVGWCCVESPRGFSVETRTMLPESATAALARSPTVDTPRFVIMTVPCFEFGP